jgi:hypothetical protein
MALIHSAVTRLQLQERQQRATAHGASDSFLDLIGGDLQVVMALQIQPPPGPGAEVAREAQGRVRRDGTLAAHDVVDANGRHADGFGQRRLAKPQRLDEVVEQDFSGMNRREFFRLQITEQTYRNAISCQRHQVTLSPDYLPALWICLSAVQLPLPLARRRRL